MTYELGMAAFSRRAVVKSVKHAAVRTNGSFQEGHLLVFAVLVFPHWAGSGPLASVQILTEYMIDEGRGERQEIKVFTLEETGLLTSISGCSR